MVVHVQPSFQNFFSENTSIDRGWVKNGLIAAWQSRRNTLAWTHVKLGDDGIRNTASTGYSPLVEKSVAFSKADPEKSSSASEAVKSFQAAGIRIQDQSPQVYKHRNAAAVSALGAEPQLPPDASSRLTTVATSIPKSSSWRRIIATYLSLTKPRLSFLIILTTTSAYSLYPIPEILSTATHAADASSALSTSTLTLAFLTIGTFFCSASANTFNMLFEPKYDAQMTRTRNRPLVRKLITGRAAAVFGILCGTGGILLLSLGTNPTVAALGALNIFLYAGVYTPMKRLSPVNTWVGAIVGGVPPLMGWCAAAGEAATNEHHSWQDLLLSENALGGWLLAALLFAWQFPHFNSLSHTIREDYRNAGHRMLAWINPARNARVALRYSLAMFPICGGLYWAGLVNPGFLAISTACNLWMTKEAVSFWRKKGAGGSARGLFWASVWQLPLVLVAALACKTGIWDGFFEKDEPLGMEETAAYVSAEGQAGLYPEAAKEQHPSWNMSMLGFKRPS